MPHNVEKSAFRRGAYVGYGAGFVWHITREGDQWAAKVINWITPSDRRAVRGRTLRDVAAAIEAAA